MFTLDPSNFYKERFLVISHFLEVKLNNAINLISRTVKLGESAEIVQFLPQFFIIKFSLALKSISIVRKANKDESKSRFGAKRIMETS